MAAGEESSTPHTMDIVELVDLELIAGATWGTIKIHPTGATCLCPVFAVIENLLRLGYTISKT